MFFFRLFWGLERAVRFVFHEILIILFGINVNNILLSSICDMMTVMTTVTLLKTSFAVPKVSENPPNAIEGCGGRRFLILILQHHRYLRQLFRSLATAALARQRKLQITRSFANQMLPHHKLKSDSEDYK